MHDADVEDEAVVRILRSWGVRFECTTALELGFVRDDEDGGFEKIVREYKEGLDSQGGLG